MCIRDRTYDGAPVFSGEKGGVHKIIQQSHKYAHFVHCYAQMCIRDRHNAILYMQIYLEQLCRYKMFCCCFIMYLSDLVISVIALCFENGGKFKLIHCTLFIHEVCDY